jgi:hypothetical protein
VTIPGRGDLSPPHRHVPIGRYLTILVVLALVAGAGYAGYRGLHRGTSDRPGAKLALCPKASVTPTKAAPGPKVDVLNASLVTGLATEVAHELRHRGLRVGSVGNAAAVGKGVATVRYSADRTLWGLHLAAEIPGAKSLPVAGHGVLELDLNPKFTALASKRAAAAAFRRAVASAHLATPSPTPTPSPTCRPRP